MQYYIIIIYKLPNITSILQENKLLLFSYSCIGNACNAILNVKVLELQSKYKPSNDLYINLKCKIYKGRFLENKKAKSKSENCRIGLIKSGHQ